MRTAAALLVAVLLAGCAGGGEVRQDPFARLPRRSLAAARVALPEPSADRAFVLDGVIEPVGDAPRGRYRLSCEAGQHDGEPAWFVVEEFEDGLTARPEGSRPEKRVMWLSRDLSVLQSEPRMDVKADAIGTLPGALLFFRLCPAEVACYGEPPACPYVADVSAGGVMTCAAGTEGLYGVHVLLRASDRAPIEIVRFHNRHKLGRIVPRASAAPVKAR